MELEILKYYNRRDNNIAGPLIKTPQEKWWDKVNEVLYLPNGKRTRFTNADEDIISENLKYRKKHHIILDTKHLQRNGKLTTGIIKKVDSHLVDGGQRFFDKKSNFKYNQFGWYFNSYIKSDYDLILNLDEHSEIISQILKYIEEHKNMGFVDETLLCPCDNCKETRNILNSGKDTQLISDIKSLYNECINYINLPELPNFYYISNDKQINYLGFFSMIMEIFDNKFLDDLIRGIKVLDVNSVGDSENVDLNNYKSLSKLLQSNGINNDLIHKIETIHELIYNLYDNKIPKLPNLETIPIEEQINLLNHLLLVLSKHEGINDTDLINYHFKDIMIENIELPKFTESHKMFKKDKFVSNDLILKWLTFQIFLFKEKNILIDISIKKLSMLKTKQFKAFYKNISKKYIDSERIEEGLNIKIKL